MMMLVWSLFVPVSSVVLSRDGCALLQTYAATLPEIDTSQFMAEPVTDLEKLKSVSCPLEVVVSNKSVPFINQYI